jgi:hypothetical protein
LVATCYLPFSLRVFSTSGYEPNNVTPCAPFPSHFSYLLWVLIAAVNERRLQLHLQMRLIRLLIVMPHDRNRDGLQRSTVDQCLFVKVYDDGTFLYVGVATDDFLCAFATFKHFDDFRQFLTKYFKLTVNTGPVLEFIGLWIIQSEHIISIDQAKYIFEILEAFYGSDVERIKHVKTPMRYDSAFEKELFESTPLSASELKEYSLRYKGSYRYHTGCI